MVTRGQFPLGPAISLGVGLGGFFDGIVFHQVLQWHHMVSSWYPPTSIENLRLNTLWDGLFHSATYVLVALGFYAWWKASRRGSLYWSGKLLGGALLGGWGGFNLVEGLVDHHLLSLHHVNELVNRNQWLLWDLGFLLWGLLMLVGGSMLFRKGRLDQQRSTAV